MSDFIRALAEESGRYPRSEAALGGSGKNDSINAAIRSGFGYRSAEGSHGSGGRIHTGSTGGPTGASFDKALADKVVQDMKGGAE